MDEAMDTSSDAVEAANNLSDLAVTDDLPIPSTAMDTSPILDRRMMRNASRATRNLASTSGWMSTLRTPSSSESPAVERERPPSPTTQVDHGILPVQPSFHHEFSHEQDEALNINNAHPIQATEVITIHGPTLIDLVSPDDEASSENSVGVGEDISDGDTNDNPMVESQGSLETDMPSTSHVLEANEDDLQYEPQAEGSDVNPPQVHSESIPVAENAQAEPALNNIAIETSTNQIQSNDGHRHAISVDVENLPLAQRIRSPDPSPVKSPPPLKKIKQDPALNVDDSDGEDEGKLCPICFDVWTNAGDHRLVSLRCGHLFGQHCIQHWLQIHKANDRRCPQCKKKASLKDLRQLYASKIKVLDTSEQEQLKSTIKKLEEEKERLTRELAYERQLNQEAMKVQQEQQMKLRQLQTQGFIPQSQQSVPTDSLQNILAQIRINLLHRVEVSREGGCRVLAFNEWKEVLVASQSSPNLFADFGIRMIDTNEFRLRQLMPMHSKAIRDLAFNLLRKDLLLSVSLDRTAKIYCMSSNTSVMTFNTEAPLWSCCWDGDNSNVFFAGSQNGIVFQYDIRNTHTEVSRLVTQGDTAPVISLAPVSAGDWLPRGGFFSCRLNRLRLYERVGSADFSTFPVEIDGPFSALNYNHKTKCMLLSTRPNGQNPHAQHQLYQMAYLSNKPQYHKIHSLMGGTTQRVMSRPCLMDGVGKAKSSLICAYQESEAHVAVWSASTGHKIPAGTLQCAEPVMALCPVQFADRYFLASLSDKNLRVYQFS